MNTPTLSLTVMPDWTVLPEWIDTGRRASSQTEDIETIVFNRYTDDPATWLFYLGFLSPDAPGLSSSLVYFIACGSLFVRELSRIPDLETLRENSVVEPPDDHMEDLVQRAPSMPGAEYIDREFMDTLWTGYQQAFSTLIQKHDGPVTTFFSDLNPAIHLAGRVFFHLVENRNGELPFAFMATYSSGMGLNGKPKHLPLKHALAEYGADGQRLIDLLSTVYAAAEGSTLVREMIDSGDLFHPLAWDAADALQFLKEVPLYEDSGVLCRIPDWWKPGRTNISMQVTLGEKKPAHVGLNALVDFRADILLGDMVLSLEDARQMLAASEGLMLLKNKWVSVDHDKLNAAIQACETAEALNEEGLSFRDAMRLQLDLPSRLHIPDEDLNLSVTNGEWLQSAMAQLTRPDHLPAAKPARGFTARLRPYQKKGLQFLACLDAFNFGACLADDMGLGKTVQLLAFLSILKQRKPHRASLLIVPASLIANWITEIDRFFPGLVVTIAHPGFVDPPAPGTRKKGVPSMNTRQINGCDLIITTYALVQKYNWIANHPWRYVILDEAQAIKNPGSRQTKAVKKLTSDNRIILTGTPIENRLADLWSLFDFLNQGLLGNKAEFTRFAKSLDRHPKKYAHLRNLISPFILRRLKTDKTVITDLPDKVEINTFADLSRKQIVLYRKAVTDLERIIADADEQGIKRKGVVLSFLMRFKQLCNHPDQLTGTGDFKETDSGKFIRLRDIAQTVHDKRERMLVFTQFKEMAEPLRAFLQTLFDHPGLVLHGSVPAAKRKPIIDTFQGDAYCPFMVLSLKAGGVGLNLTRANHVIHFDRWWNPAVENQATDRAFRIGQKKNVMVHKFITKGTVEEKIDAMLRDKQTLSDQVVTPSGDTLITELDNTQLINLFQLRL